MCARAAEPADLGEGLLYLRVHSLGESAQALESALAGGRALVIDLRRATANPEDAASFGEALARRNSRAALLALVSPDTPASLAAALGRPPRGALTLGVAGAQPKPAVIVAQPADADRRAYDALDGGMKLGDLVNGKIEKERFDESSLVQEFKNGNGNAAPPPPPDPAKPSPEKAPVLTDRVLQRAIHLHRALAALKAHG
ncbi:MAG: hypothetical protein C0502_04950 [Opitutus sp.]|nr:hypothetical protein [Opitutus sp.]